jgi:hypothetical protein
MATRDEIAQALIDQEFARLGAPQVAPPIASPAGLAARRMRQSVQPIGGPAVTPTPYGYGHWPRKLGATDVGNEAEL